MTDDDRRVALEHRWLETVGPVAAVSPDRVVLAGDALLARYAEPARAYHNLTHLAELLDRLDEVSAPGAPDRATVLAGFFHDAVYDVHAPDNEEQSARYATVVLTVLGVDPAVVDDVAVLVQATAAHDPAVVPAALRGRAAALFDADLAILAAEQGRYDEYAAGVRGEYAYADDAAFAGGRATKLQALLARESLFLTGHGRTSWETRARRNVTAELRRLRDGDSGAGRRP